MSGVKSIPKLSRCLQLYRRAYSQHGMDRFTASQVREDDSVEVTEHLLELAVAYGLLDWDGTSFCVAVAPDLDPSEWRSNHGTVLDSICTEISQQLHRPPDPGAKDKSHVETSSAPTLHVSQSDSAREILEQLKTLNIETGSTVVLRAPGEDAAAVQRLTDRLYKMTDKEDRFFSGTIQKGSSSVVGSDKNSLEFEMRLEVTS